MTAEQLVALGTLVAAAAAWAAMFLPSGRGLWTRTWLAAAFLTGLSVAALAALDRLGSTIGPLTPAEVGVGLLAGTAWLVATQVGFRVLRRLVPVLGEQVRDLYHLGAQDTAGRMAGPIAAIGVAEELVFRGVLQGIVGLPLAVLAYAAVQVFERSWALVVAALLSGTVWGLLFAWRDGLVAPVIAHVLWTGALTFAWTLPATDDRGHAGVQTSVSGQN